MNVPLEVAFRGIVKTDDLEHLIREQAAKLERVCPRLTGCRVAVERPHRHPKSGSWFRVRIDLTVPPGREIAVKREPGEGDLHEDLHKVIVQTFRSARETLRHVMERQRGRVKSRTGVAMPAGVVAPARRASRARRAAYKST